MLAEALALITLLVTALLTYYLRRVPGGGSCPRCGGILQRSGSEIVGAIPARLRWTDPARCPNCDWSGRMRRDVVEPVRLWVRRREEGRR